MMLLSTVPVGTGVVTRPLTPQIAESALAHKVGNVVEQAYRRSMAIEKRRELMEEWAAFCERRMSGKVVQIRP
jgi:hypothetical protein